MICKSCDGCDDDLFKFGISSVDTSYQHPLILSYYFLLPNCGKFDVSQCLALLSHLSEETRGEKRIRESLVILLFPRHLSFG